MQVQQLADMMARAFDQHVDNLASAVTSHGVTVIASDKVRNTQVVMMVSPAAYKALMDRMKEGQGDE